MSPEQDFSAYQAAIIKADCERMRQASVLAAAQLGPIPEPEDWNKYVDYIAAHNDKAREILGRLI